MDCRDVKKSCQPFLDGQLQPDVLQQVDQHLAQCQGCKETYDSQRIFHSLLKTVLVRSADRIAPEIKQSLLKRVSDARQAPRKPIDASALFRAFGATNVRAMPMRQSVATAAACMFILSGVVGFQATCVTGQCSLVRAAQHEHDNIIAGNRTMLASSSDLQILDKSLHSKGYTDWLKTIPDLEKCDLEAECCGCVRLPGLPEGVFVKYVQCTGRREPMTLMVINTPLSPDGEAHKQFLTAQHVRHNVISWHADNNGPLYILVSQMPFNDTLAAAESIRVAKH